MDTAVLPVSSHLEILQNSPPPKRSRLSLRRKTQLLQKSYCEEEESTSASPSERKRTRCDTGTLDIQVVDVLQDENTSPNVTNLDLNYLVESLSEKSGDIRTLGLPNCGNTCYVNSVLQVLRYSPNFLNSLHLLLATQDQMIKLSDGTNGSKEVEFFQQLHTLYSVMKRKEILQRINTNKDYYTHLLKPVHAVIDSLREISLLFEEGEQHDAHELLITILSIFSTACESLKNYLPMKSDSTILEVPCQHPSMAITDSESLITSPSQEIQKRNTSSKKQKINVSFNFSVTEDLNLGFEGKSVNVIRCRSCELGPEREESFMNLEVNIPQLKKKWREKGIDTVDLRECLSQETSLTEDNKRFCENCKNKSEALMYTKVINPPSLLLLHFGWLMSSSAMTDIEKTRIKVIIPLILHTTDNKEVFCCSSEQSYKLFAVVLHIGNSTIDGHYVAFIKDAYQNLVVESNNKKPMKNTIKPEQCCSTEEITQLRNINDTSKWLLFDDHQVFSVQIDEDSETFPYFHYLSVTASPCMIFYHKV